jgi:hypothetical protein
MATLIFGKEAILKPVLVMVQMIDGEVTIICLLKLTPNKRL